MNRLHPPRVIERVIGRGIGRVEPQATIGHIDDKGRRCRNRLRKAASLGDEASSAAVAHARPISEADPVGDGRAPPRVIGRVIIEVAQGGIQPPLRTPRHAAAGQTAFYERSV